MLELVDVRKRYAVGPIAVDVLKGIDLDVQPGDMLSIMGPSGCGKSTLMNIIGLLDRPSGGSYRLQGREVSALTDDELSALRNARIGFVFQAFHLLPRLSALGNVGLPLVYRGLDNQEIARRARAALDRVGLGERAEHRPSELSGGQQQRVAIARALCMEPRIMLFDEPTSALDPEMINEVLDVMVELAASGMTMICVTHEMGFARRVADKMVFMDHGQIVEMAEPERFFSNPESERCRDFLRKILHH